MNIKQLEELRRGIALMRGTLEEDSIGGNDIRRTIKELEKAIIEQMKYLLWKRYLEAEE